MFLVLSTVIFVSGYLLPEPAVMPVQGADPSSWHPETFWYHPWGKSGVHKGIDIFAGKGTPVKAATYGWVVFAGHINMGGHVVIIWGPKWRFHYYAHLDHHRAAAGRWVNSGETIGTVGDSGNAKGKPPHLHYSIVTPLPYLWRWDSAVPQGWKKMFFLDPGAYLTADNSRR